MRLKNCLLIVLPVLCLAAAAAQAASGRLYFAGYLGLNTYSDAEFSESSAPASGEIELKNAISFGGALGLRLAPQWRVEAEASYRSGDLDRINIDGAGSFKLGGDLDTWLWMLNLYYDFDFEWDFLQPYVTAGVGLAGHEA